MHIAAQNDDINMLRLLNSLGGQVNATDLKGR